MNENERTLGELMQEQRGKLGLSLRSAAEQLNMSHVMLGQIERNLAPLSERFWARTADVLKLDMKTVAEAAAKKRAVKLNFHGTPDKYRELGLALARRIEGRDLKDDQIEALVKILTQ